MLTREQANRYRLWLVVAMAGVIGLLALLAFVGGHSAQWPMRPGPAGPALSPTFVPLLALALIISLAWLTVLGLAATALWGLKRATVAVAVMVALGNATNGLLAVAFWAYLLWRLGVVARTAPPELNP